MGPTCPLPRDSHKWCRFLWALGPIAKGQPQVVQISWGPVGAPEAMTPRSQLPLVLANGCGFFLSRCGGALVDGFELPALFCGHAGPSGVWPLGPTCPLPRVSHRWCRFHGGQLGAPEAMTQQPIAIGVWPVVVVFLFEQVWWCLGWWV